MKKIIFILFVLTNAFLAQAQNENAYFHLYFATDKANIAPTEAATLDSLVHYIEGKTVSRIYIDGNTDNVASHQYNVVLSNKRAQRIQEYLIAKGCKQDLISITGLAETYPIRPNTTPEGKRMNRRVDITVVYQPVKQTVIKDTVDKRQVKRVTEIVYVDKVKDSLALCSRDTMIALGKNSYCVFNICEYRKYKDCIHIKEIVTEDDILNSNMITETEDHKPLITAGMFDINVCGDVKLEKPARIVIPVANPDRDMSLWDMNPDGTWSKSKQQLVFGDNNGYYYMSFDFYGSGRRNCDKPRNPSMSMDSVLVTFRCRRNSQLQKIRLMVDGTVVQSSPAQLLRRGNEVDCYIPVPIDYRIRDEIKLKAVAVDAKGRTRISRGYLVDYRKSIFRGYGKIRDRFNYVLGLFRIPEKIIYRKYRFKDRDWAKV